MLTYVEQAECEELATKVETLTVENMALRNELNRMAEECKKLTAENASIMVLYIYFAVSFSFN